MLSELKEEYKNADIFTQLAKHSDEQLSKRLSLYFMQNGKSMYSGKAIDINRIADNTYCQIDHVLPQSYIKDDSFENTVLVLSEENQRKGDSLLLDADIRRKMAGIWHELHRVKLIGDKKYKNLTRSVVTDRQMEGFINRQLVETSQIVKFVRMLLKSQYSDTEICSIKASLSHEIREKYNLPKIREVNDYHHAHDAFLACEMGRFLSIRYEEAFTNPVGLTKLVRKFVKKESEEAQKQHRIPGTTPFLVASFSKPGFDLETGEVTRDEWNPIEEVEKIKKTFDFKDCFISRMPEMTSGTFWDETVYSPKGKVKTLIETKKNLSVEKYGGYSGENSAFFFIYKSKGESEHLNFAPFPLSLATREDDVHQLIESYAVELCREAKEIFTGIVIPQIYKYQKIEWNGQQFYLTGKKEIRSAVSVFFSQDEMSKLISHQNDISLENGEMVEILDNFLLRAQKRSEKLYKQLKIDENKGKVVELSSSQIYELLCGLTSIFNGKINMLNLSSIGGSKYAGCIQPAINKEINKKENTFYVIDQSVTGMFERRRRIGL